MNFNYRQQSSVDRTTSNSNDDPDEIKHPPRKGKKRKKSKPHPIRLGISLISIKLLKNWKHWLPFLI